MIIVVLWRQMVKLYEKARFVLYSMEIQCTSLRYSNNYSCLLNDIASAHCLMISSPSEVQHFISFQVFVPHCSHNITHLLDNLQFWYSSHEFFYLSHTFQQFSNLHVFVIQTFTPTADNFQFW